jgi:hypothetical protein
MTPSWLVGVRDALPKDRSERSSNSIPCVAPRLVRKAAVRVAPGLMADRARRYERRLRRRIGLTALAEQATQRLGNHVLAGPFAGMTLPEGWEASTTSPVLLLLGLYEAPLHDAIEAAIARQPPRIVNVGSAAGYYTVGLALRVPSSRVNGYDISRSARAETSRLARVNGVSDRVSIKARCKRIPPADLLVCDIDGGEASLLSSSTLAGLGATTVIVETHDTFAPGVTSRLARAFEATHAVEVIRDEPHLRPEALDWMTDEQASLALDEMRADQPGVWLVATPRAH